MRFQFWFDEYKFKHLTMTYWYSNTFNRVRVEIIFEFIFPQLFEHVTGRIMFELPGHCLFRYNQQSHAAPLTRFERLCGYVDF